MPAEDVGGFLEKYSGGKAASATKRLRRLSVALGNAMGKWDRRYFVLRAGSSTL